MHDTATQALDTDIFDSWLSSVGDASDNKKLIDLVTMLYKSWSFSTVFLCFCILAVSFLAPSNKPLVFFVQVLVCLSLFCLNRYFDAWHQASLHRKSIYFLLVLNLVALGANIFDLFLRTQKSVEKRM